MTRPCFINLFWMPNTKVKTVETTNKVTGFTFCWSICSFINNCFWRSKSNLSLAATDASCVTTIHTHTRCVTRLSKTQEKWRRCDRTNHKAQEKWLRCDRTSHKTQEKWLKCDRTSHKAQEKWLRSYRTSHKAREKWLSCDRTSHKTQEKWLRCDRTSHKAQEKWLWCDRTSHKAHEKWLRCDRTSHKTDLQRRQAGHGAVSLCQSSSLTQETFSYVRRVQLQQEESKNHGWNTWKDGQIHVCVRVRALCNTSGWWSDWDWQFTLSFSKHNKLLVLEWVSHLGQTVARGSTGWQLVCDTSCCCWWRPSSLHIHVSFSHHLSRLSQSTNTQCHQLISHFTCQSTHMQWSQTITLCMAPQFSCTCHHCNYHTPVININTPVIWHW